MSGVLDQEANEGYEETRWHADQSAHYHIAGRNGLALWSLLDSVASLRGPCHPSSVTVQLEELNEPPNIRQQQAAGGGSRSRRFLVISTRSGNFRAGLTRLSSPPPNHHHNSKVLVTTIIKSFRGVYYRSSLLTSPTGTRNVHADYIYTCCERLALC